jgi:cell division initiation protein
MSIISPKDIRKSDFKKTFRGYDPIEVDAFLETVSIRYERIFEENHSLNDKLKVLNADIDVYKENETTLQKAIVKTQDMSEEIIANAKKRAENIIKEAELNSQKVMQEVDKDIMTKKQELEEMKLRNDKLVEDVKLFFLEKLNEMDEFIKNRNIYSMELANIAATNDENMNSNEDEDLSKLKKVSISTARTNFSD